jgi:hypothetical protein
MNGPYTGIIVERAPRADGRFDITIEGPGLLNPLLITVVNSEEADAIVQALNFAYAQGALSERRNRERDAIM